MQRIAFPLLVVFVLATAAAVPVNAMAMPKPITGKLSKRGYTVVALGDQGFAKSVVARTGKFKLRPTADKVTLHLRAPNGSYAGPVVLVADRGARKSKRVIVGVKAGANLGRVRVEPGKGVALAKRVAKKSLDTKRTATAKKGVPIGAGNFGRVAVATLKGPSADRDLDGIPAPLDIDDDGDLVLDDVERGSAGGARAAQAGHVIAESYTAMNLHGNANLPPLPQGTQPVNANAPGIGDAQIDAALRSDGQLSGGAGPIFASSELDCGGLSYCSPGGTGRHIIAAIDPFPTEPFPACCDADGDGLGSLAAAPNGTITLLHGASSDQIRAGDQLLIKGTCSNFTPSCPAGRPGEATMTLRSVFATSPALASYTDEAGVTHAVSYPIENGGALPVSDGPDDGSDVSVRLTFWRPQRRAIPKEITGTTGKWIDMGGLYYSALGCPQSSYSAVDPTLEPSQRRLPTDPAVFFTDKAIDRLANPGNTFSYTLNLTQCFTALGFAPGDARGLRFWAGLPANSATGAMAGYLFRNQP